MSNECKHPTCEGEHCRRPKKEKKVYQLKRTPLKKAKLPTGDINTLTHNELEKVAQNAFNARIRERDKDKGCICGCGRPVEQAGHFFPAGGYSGVRFDEVNVNGIAKQCNYFKNTAAVDPEIAVGIVARYGLHTASALREKANSTRAYKWERSELIAIINNKRA